MSSHVNTCVSNASVKDEPPVSASEKLTLPFIDPKPEPLIVKTVCVPADTVVGEKVIALGGKAFFICLNAACVFSILKLVTSI